MQADSIIPKPQKVTAAKGEFKLLPGSKIIPESEKALEAAALLAEYLRPATGFELPVRQGSAAVNGDIVLTESGDDETDDTGFVNEQYQLGVDSGILNLRALNAAGLARAIQTVRQLFPAQIMADSVQKNIPWSFKAVRIEDFPAFRWRGMLLDVARYFFSVEDVCRLIDLFALHKFNVFHLHLSDDQGWRVEIKRYPRLTEVGSVRECTVVGHRNDTPNTYDNTAHGGFYTQEDIRRIVEYAARRHITVVPEIDMPGHAQAALAAYPELGNNPEIQHEVSCLWYINRHILSTRDSTVEFMKNVLDEVIDLFPSRLIHIGGDEVVKDEWKLSRETQRLMHRRGLKNVEELQEWFTAQMVSYVNSRSCYAVGWDEIIEGCKPGKNIIMSWHPRDEQRVSAAAKQGYNVVRATCEYTYFDFYQADPEHEPVAIGGDLPCEKVYRFDPLPKGLPEEHKKHIIGGQGNLWTEYISTLEHVEYMAFPRTCALAEILWTAPEDRCFADFRDRLNEHRQRLETLNVRAHRLP